MDGENPPTHPQSRGAPKGQGPSTLACSLSHLTTFRIPLPTRRAPWLAQSCPVHGICRDCLSWQGQAKLSNEGEKHLAVGFPSADSRKRMRANPGWARGGLGMTAGNKGRMSRGCPVTYSLAPYSNSSLREEGVLGAEGAGVSVSCSHGRGEKQER